MRYQHKQRSGSREHSKSLKPQEPGGLSLQKAIQRYNAGLFLEDETLLESHLKCRPKDDAALNVLGLIDHQYGRCDAAIQLEEADPETVFRHHQEWSVRHYPETGHIYREYPNDAIPNCLKLLCEM
jgi:hypothetical protein